MRYYEALREATMYVNDNYRGRAAKAAGRNISREGKKWVLAQTAKMIEMEMLDHGVTRAEIHAFVDECAATVLDEYD